MIFSLARELSSTFGENQLYLVINPFFRFIVAFFQVYWSIRKVSEQSMGSSHAKFHKKWSQEPKYHTWSCTTPTSKFQWTCKAVSQQQFSSLSPHFSTKNPLWPSMWGFALNSQNLQSWRHHLDKECLLALDLYISLILPMDYAFFDQSEETLTYLRENVDAIALWELLTIFY
jgi:hypothetical protein